MSVSEVLRVQVLASIAFAMCLYVPPSVSAGANLATGTQVPTATSSSPHPPLRRLYGAQNERTRSATHASIC